MNGASDVGLSGEYTNACRSIFGGLSSLIRDQLEHIDVG